eukprot:SAG31_NODE_3775_length_3896_cov_2.532666_1_plen_278_part_00
MPRRLHCAKYMASNLAHRGAAPVSSLFPVSNLCHRAFIAQIQECSHHFLWGPHSFAKRAGRYPPARISSNVGPFIRRINFKCTRRRPDTPVNVTSQHPRRARGPAAHIHGPAVGPYERARSVRLSLPNFLRAAVHTARGIRTWSMEKVYFEMEDAGRNFHAGVPNVPFCIHVLGIRLLNLGTLTIRVGDILKYYGCTAGKAREYTSTQYNVCLFLYLINRHAHCILYVYMYLQVDLPINTGIRTESTCLIGSQVGAFHSDLLSAAGISKHVRTTTSK